MAPERDDAALIARALPALEPPPKGLAALQRRLHRRPIGAPLLAPIPAIAAIAAALLWLRPTIGTAPRAIPLVLDAGVPALAAPSRAHTPATAPRRLADGTVLIRVIPARREPTPLDPASLPDRGPKTRER